MVSPNALIAPFLNSPMLCSLLGNFPSSYGNTLSHTRYISVIVPIINPLMLPHMSYGFTINPISLTFENSALWFGSFYKAKTNPQNFNHVQNSSITLVAKTVLNQCCITVLILERYLFLGISGF